MGHAGPQRTKRVPGKFLASFSPRRAMLSYLLWLGLGTLGAYASAINSSSVSVTCAAIGRAVSSASDVYYPGKRVAKLVYTVFH